MADNAIPVRTKAEAEKKAKALRTRGKKGVKITKIDKRALSYRMGNRWWVAWS